MPAPMPMRRSGSPSGGSTLITSAPKSAITVAAAGPAMNDATSSTRRPANGSAPALWVSTTVPPTQKTGIRDQGSKGIMNVFLIPDPCLLNPERENPRLSRDQNDRDQEVRPRTRL